MGGQWPVSLRGCSFRASTDDDEMLFSRGLENAISCAIRAGVMWTICPYAVYVCIFGDSRSICSPRGCGGKPVAGMKGLSEIWAVHVSIAVVAAAHIHVGNLAKLQSVVLRLPELGRHKSERDVIAVDD